MKILRILLTLFVLLIAGLAVKAQPPAPRPSIVVFDADIEAITVDAVANGNVNTTLSWHVIFVNDTHRLTLERYFDNRWESLLGEGDFIGPVGSTEITITSPLNFGPPTYKLSVLDADGAVITERIHIIPFTQTSGTPVIERFETVDSPDSELTMVAWDISNRTPTSNLVFEQVFANGDSASVELPRENVWVTSMGSGVVAPEIPDGVSAIQLRLRVVDVVTGRVFDESVITVTTSEEEPTPTPTPEPTVMPVATEEATKPSVPVSDTAAIEDESGPVAFIVDPQSAAPGATITLAWQVTGVQPAIGMYDTADFPPDWTVEQITQRPLPPPLEFFNNLTPIGTMTITIPVDVAGDVRLILGAPFASDVIVVDVTVEREAATG